MASGIYLNEYEVPFKTKYYQYFRNLYHTSNIYIRRPTYISEDLEVAVSACKFAWHFINPAKVVELLTVNDIEKPPCFSFPIETKNTKIFGCSRRYFLHSIPSCVVEEACNNLTQWSNC